MTHTFDTKVKIPATVDTTTNANPATGTVTLAADATLLTVAMIYGGNTARTGGAPTANGIPLTQADIARGVTEATAELWYLASGTGGGNTVIVVPNAGTAKNLDVFVSSYKAAAGYSSALDSYTGTATTSANPGVSVNTTVPGCAIVSVCADGTNAWSPTAQSGTVIYNDDCGTWGGGAQYILTPDIRIVQCRWDESNDDWGVVAASFKQAGGPTQISVSDTGNGIDNVTATMTAKSVSMSDSGQGTDQANEDIGLSQSDQGIGTDVVSLQVSLSQSDAGNGSDDISHQTSISIDDNGSGLDLSHQLSTLLSIVDTTISIDSPVPLGCYHVELNGSTSYITFGSGTALNDLHAGDFTVEVWTRLHNLGNGLYAFIIGKYPLIPDGGWEVDFENIGLDQIRVDSWVYGGGVAYTEQFITLNRWTHILMCYSNSGDKTPYIAINGQWCTYSSQGALTVFHTDASGPLHVGKQPNINDEYLDGDISWIRISSSIRYAVGTDFAPDPRCTAPNIDDGVIEQWNFDEGESDIVHASINTPEDDGNIINGVWREYTEISASLGITDGTLGADNVLIGNLFYLNDNGNGQDLETVSSEITKTIDDVGYGNDEIFATGTAAGSQCVADIVLRFTGITVSISDNGTGIDDIAQILASLGLTDVSVNDDNLSISVSLSLGDTGLGTDAISVLTAAIVLIQEIASAFDNVSIQAQLTTSENALGQDTLNLQITFSVIDTSTSIDTTSIGAGLSLVDNAIGIDNPDIATALGIIDTALGGDFIGLSALLQLIENGLGSDELSNLIASLFVSDNALGTEIINILTALLLTISEQGTGSDDVVNLLASLSVAELGTITEAISQLASLSLSDIAAGVDDQQLAALLGMTDGALGGDFLDLSALIPMPEAGSGIDTLSQLLASLSLTETVTAGDLLQILANMSVSDSGSGSDSITLFTGILKAITDAGLGSDQISISASLSVGDDGTGTDALVIQVSLSVLDTALGTDAVTVLIYTLKEINDLAFGIDGVDILASLNIGETSYGIDDPAILALLDLLDGGAGLDTPDISASLTITDTSSAADIISILQTMLVAILDSGSGTDAITSITASIPVSENGLGSDEINQILAALAVADFGYGVDTVVKYDSTSNILKITVTLSKPRITTKLSKPTIDIELNKPVVKFSLSDP